MKAEEFIEQRINEIRATHQSDPIVQGLCDIAMAMLQSIDSVIGMESQIEGEWGVGEHNALAHPNDSDLMMWDLLAPFVAHPDYDPAWGPQIRWGIDRKWEAERRITWHGDEAAARRVLASGVMRGTGYSFDLVDAHLIYGMNDTDEAIRLPS